MSSDSSTEVRARTVRLAELGSEKTVSEKVLVCQQVTPREVVRCAIELSATQVIQESNPHFVSELDSAIEMLDHPASFFEFPISTILTPAAIGAESENRLKMGEYAFTKTSEKDLTLEVIEQAVTALARPQSLLYDVKLVTDELFMNALYNAPVGPNQPKVDRSVDVTLPPGKACRMMLGKDEDRLVLVCEDRFGSLDINTYLGRMFKCYEDGVKNAMNWGMGGAGIGCYMIFESCMSIYIGVKPSQKTVIACVFALGKGTRQRQELSKSIHYTKT